MELDDSKKFVAILDFEDSSNTYFSIIDVKRYEKGKPIPEENIYLPEVYNTFENLDMPCKRDSANLFCVEGVLGGRSGLARFLKPLPWVIEASRYTKTKGDKMPEFDKNINYYEDESEVEM